VTSLKAFQPRLWKFTNPVFLGVFLIIGLFTYSEYGLGWDEGEQHHIGEVSWNYVFKGDTGIKTYLNRDYGVAFELPLIILEKLLGLTDPHDVFLMRHLVTHLFFLLAAFFCYKLCFLLYNNEWIALIGFLLYTLHPHLYAHSFFNTKDIPLYSLFIICFYFQARAFEHKSALRFLLLGILLGLLINIRIIGVLLLGCCLFFLAIDAALERKPKRHAWLMFVLLASACTALYATWPNLWENPVSNFKEALANMSKFRWFNTNLFNGDFVAASKLEWNYIPVWFGITTPIPFLIGGLGGFLLVIVLAIKKPMHTLSTIKGKCNATFVICFLVPLVAVIVLNSVLYDGWRHLYFVYASWIMLAVFFVDELYKYVNKKWLITALVSASFIVVIAQMVIFFPYQHVYFNNIVSFNRPPEYIRHKYEMDYWGTSYKQAFKTILSRDPSDTIFVNVDNMAGFFNTLILEEKERRRISLVPLDKARYFITNFRWHPQDYPYRPFSTIKVLNNTISATYVMEIKPNVTGTTN